MPNPIQALRALLEPPLMAGEVLSAAGGELRIQTPDGALHTAIGAATVGTTVFFRPGRTVEGDAPAVTFVDIDV